MFSQYQAQTNKRITDSLRAQLVETENMIAENCQTIAKLQNNNRVLKNSSMLLLRKMEEVERVEYNQKVNDLAYINHLMTRSQPIVATTTGPSETSPTFGTGMHSNA